MKRKMPFGVLILISIWTLQSVANANGSSGTGAGQWSQIPEAPDEPSQQLSDQNNGQSDEAKNIAEKIKPVATGKEKSGDLRGSQTEEISATVRLIRANPETEVFFKDYKQSLIIPKDSHHNQIYELCENSRKMGAPVKLSIDPKARRILSPSKPSGNADGLSTP